MKFSDKIWTNNENFAKLDIFKLELVIEKWVLHANITRLEYNWISIVLGPNLHAF